MQTPAPVDYVRATSVANAIALLQMHGEDARILAGGHSLLPMMKLRLARPDILIDIQQLDEQAMVNWIFGPPVVSDGAKSLRG